MLRRTIVLVLTAALFVALTACGGQVSSVFQQSSSGNAEVTDSILPAATAPATAFEAPREESAAAPSASAPGASGADGDAPVGMGAGDSATDPAGSVPSAATPAATMAAAEPEAAPGAPAGPTTMESRTAPEASLRAGEINDNEQFADYLTYLAGYQWSDVRPADVTERYLISVLDERQRPVLDARLTIYDGERVVYTGRTYAGGKALFFPRLFETENTSEFRIVAAYGQAQAETTFRRGEREQIELGLRDVRTDDTLRLDLLFLLDTTGSMGDELDRIQQTIDSIAERIDAFAPRPEIRFGLVAYRDAGDEYVTRPVSFSEDLATFRDQLRQLTAEGGGDTPEALDEALYEGVLRADWRDESAVRLAFLVADAGPHVPGQAQFTYLDGAREAAARGIKIYPIAASNTDPQAEYVFRQLAQQTMAGFVFLTYQPGASSGAPGESTPLEAGAQPYTVERLDDLIVGIVERELAAAVGAR